MGERFDPVITVVPDKKRVAYMYDAEIGSFDYEVGHPMKPFRIRMAHELVTDYGLHNNMEIYRPKPAGKLEMTQFHTDEYIEFLSKVTPDNKNLYPKEQEYFNIGGDSPIFYGMFSFCGISAAGSMEGAARLCRGKCDIAVNWAGGLHHAKKGEGSGFCYVNDIVLGILELLRFHQRVLYIDIDVHHGDGVEEAFYTTDRVLTVSFHKYGEFFPGTGDVRDIGVGPGKNYAVNVPLRDGIDDESYMSLFKPIITCAVECYRPEAIVLQCGGDSLSGDRLGGFNLSLAGHAGCVKFTKGLGLPLLVLGGGGYTIKNVARAWALETGVLVGKTMDSILPYGQFYHYYAPEFELNVRASNMSNSNTPEYLEKIKTVVLQNLRSLTIAPSVQMMDVPRGLETLREEDDKLMHDLDEEQNKDKRHTPRQWDQHVDDNDGLISDSEGDDEPNKRVRRRELGIPKRRNIMDYRQSQDVA